MQTRLQAEWLNFSQRAAICKRIVEIFQEASSYEEMLQLRETIDHTYQGASPLHTLVYHDLDKESCHKVLRLINESVRHAHETTPEKIKYSYMIYSDIDDTIKGSLNDQKTKISGFYPSSLEFYKQLGAVKLVEGEEKEEKVKLAFLSARPTRLQRLWNGDLKRKLPAETKFYALYGSTTSIARGSLYYTFVSWLSAIADLLPEGVLKRKIKAYAASEESKTFINFAIEKRCNIDRDLLLRPEARAIFVGDCGEGDLIFLLTKNCGVPLPLEDPRIPDEYRGDKNWEGSLDTPCNPTHKPLYLGFAHALSSATNYGSRPDPKFRVEFERELHAHVFDNYVDNALYCRKQGILNRESCDKIVEDARSWVTKQKITHHTGEIEELSPDKKYRQKLLQSIHTEH